MTRVLWSVPAAEQLGLIRSSTLRRRVYLAITGLARFPRKGRIPPEVGGFPDLLFPANLRELVFPKLVRVFYRYDEASRTLWVLGMKFRGQDVGADWLARILEP